MSLESIPTYFSDYMGISLGAAQVLLSIVVIMMFLLPTFYLSKGNKIISLLILLLTEGALVGIGWFPFWFLIATVVLLAFGVATLGTNAVVGE